jgi:putative hydrolase of the HAD superfamily
MPVFLDLDNTLVDRDGAFLLWAQQVVPAWGGDAVDIDWLVRADDSGYTGRSDLASEIMERLQPVVTDVDELVASMRAGLVEHLECFPGVLQALDELVSAGQSLVVVTNGEPGQQRAKLERTGLNSVISGAVISGDVGVKKPDPRIFEAAYALADEDGIAWMVGDNASADISGARALGWETAWVSHEQVWQEAWTPTVTARKPADALVLVRDAGVC